MNPLKVLVEKQPEVQIASFSFCSNPRGLFASSVSLYKYDLLKQDETMYDDLSSCCICISNQALCWF